MGKKLLENAQITLNSSKIAFFTISQRIAVRNTAGLLEDQNMSKGGWKKPA